MAIFTHVAVGTNDLAKARAFYDAVLAPLGYKRLKDSATGARAGARRARIHGAEAGQRQPATHANAAPSASSRRAAPQSRHFTRRRLRRRQGRRRRRAAQLLAPRLCGYCRDLDGNKLAAYCREPE